MTVSIPKSRPQKTWDDIKAVIESHGLAPHGCVLVFQRGYYRDTQGVPGRNDRGIYDDAAFVWNEDGRMRSFNANTDPSRYRIGHGTGDAKGMACVEPGVLRFTRGEHRGTYRALRQFGRFKIKRDGKPDYIEYDSDSGINVHKGGWVTTSSEGCFTIPPNQWPEFIPLVDEYCKQYGWKDSEPIFAVLLERQG